MSRLGTIVLVAGAVAAPFTAGTSLAASLALAGGEVAAGANAWADGQRNNVAAKAYGSALTNQVEAAMDLNRFAFASGVIPVDAFEQNWRFLWSALKKGATEVSTVNADFARRMIADRSGSGQWAQWWQGTLHTTQLQKFSGKLDPYGYVKFEFREPWPERGKFTDTNPLQDLPTNLPSPGEILSGTIPKTSTGQIETVTAGVFESLLTPVGIGIALVVSLAAIVLFKR